MTSFSTTTMFPILLVAFLASQRALATNTCYFPNGDIASKFAPCSTTGDGSCCNAGDFCTSLGYCIDNARGYHYRGACTDSSWLNPSCPDYCLTNSNDGNSTFVDLIACDAATTGGSWCCSYDNTNCCTSDSLYTPAFGTIFAAPTASGSSSSSTTSAPPTTSAASVTSSSTSASTTSTSTSQSTTVPVRVDTSTKTSAIVGAAVGVPLGLAACVALALYFLERRKRRNVTAGILEKPQENGQVYGGSELGGDAENTHKPYQQYELPSQRTHELPTYR